MQWEQRYQEEELLSLRSECDEVSRQVEAETTQLRVREEIIRAIRDEQQQVTKELKGEMRVGTGREILQTVHCYILVLCAQPRQIAQTSDWGCKKSEKKKKCHRGTPPSTDLIQGPI